jgi:hypothetical protein
MPFIPKTPQDFIAAMAAADVLLSLSKQPVLFASNLHLVGFAEAKKRHNRPFPPSACQIVAQGKRLESFC